MKNLKNESGITLVALVVTIIVLLILAAVSLNLVAGSEGILNKATNAVDTHEDGYVKEQASLALANAKADYYEKKYTGSNRDSVTTFAAYVADATNFATITSETPNGTVELVKEGEGENEKVTGLKLTVKSTKHEFTCNFSSDGNSITDWEEVK